MKNKTVLRKTVYSSLFIALALVFPFLTANIPVFGKSLTPMHFPVLLAGFTLGGVPGMMIGLISPFLRSVIFGAPAPIYPRVIRMAFELMGYGFFSGFLYKLLPKKPVSVYISLLGAMIAGRLCYAASWFLITLFDADLSFTVSFVIAETVTSSVPGIIFQFVIIPPAVFALGKIIKQQ